MDILFLNQFFEFVLILRLIVFEKGFGEISKLEIDSLKEDNPVIVLSFE